MVSNPQDIPILPTEILAHILQYLEYKSLYSAKLTCKRWNEIIDEFNLMEKALSKSSEFFKSMFTKSSNLTYIFIFKIRFPAQLLLEVQITVLDTIEILLKL